MSLWFGNVQSRGVLSASWTHGEAVEGGTANKTYTAVPIGGASLSRMVVVCVKGDNTLGQPTSVTVGGVACTSVVATNSGSIYNSMWAAKVPTGTTADIVVNWPGTPDRQGISVYNVQGISGITASDTDSDVAAPYTKPITIPINGVAIACGVTGNASNTTTWTNLTEDFDSGATAFSTASTSSAAGATPSVTFAPSASDSPSMVIASWGP